MYSLTNMGVKHKVHASHNGYQSQCVRSASSSTELHNECCIRRPPGGQVDLLYSSNCLLLSYTITSNQISKKGNRQPNLEVPDAEPLKGPSIDCCLDLRERPYRQAGLVVP